mmetsp:Transcript_23430/g.41141  ORF Transcript_23430/g.41141 Transcript_23430/m.41141 type:complete len:247 (+) Transcript_23430:8276-9016(+)
MMAPRRAAPITIISLAFQSLGAASSTIQRVQRRDLSQLGPHRPVRAKSVACPAQAVQPDGACFGGPTLQVEGFGTQQQQCRQKGGVFVLGGLIDMRAEDQHRLIAVTACDGIGRQLRGHIGAVQVGTGCGGIILVRRAEMGLRRFGVRGQKQTPLGVMRKGAPMILPAHGTCDIKSLIGGVAPLAICRTGAEGCLDRLAPGAGGAGGIVGAQPIALGIDPREHGRQAVCHLAPRHAGAQFRRVIGP